MNQNRHNSISSTNLSSKDKKAGTIHVVAAYIHKKEQLLLAKRAKGNLIGFWEFPGGKVESDEDPFQAIKREIKEELNIEIEPKRIIKEFFHEYTFGHVNLLLIESEPLDNVDTIRLDGSHSTFEWASLYDEREMAPLDKKIITYLKKMANN